MYQARERFRPLAGFWFLNIQKETDGNATEGFRPLAGFWFLNFIDDFLIR